MTTNHAPKRPAALGLVIGLCSITWLNAAGQVLEMCSNEAISGPHVLLKEIVRTPDVLPPEWANRSVVSAPSPGEPAEYTLTSIAYALQKYPDMKHVTLRGQLKLTLARSGRSLSLERITEALRDYVATDEAWQSTRYHVTCDTIKADCRIPADGTANIAIASLTALDMPNRYSATTEISIDGQLESTIPITATIAPMQPVWVATRPLSRGHTLSAEDLTITWLSPAAAKPYIPTEDSLTGMEVKRNIKADQPLSPHFLMPPLCADRGQLINVNVQRGSLRVGLRARALDAGRRGETIACVNERSQRRLMVRLTDRQEGTVDF